MAEASYATTSSGQQVIILKEGTSRNKGKRAQNNNIDAARNKVQTTMGADGADALRKLDDASGAASQVQWQEPSGNPASPYNDPSF